ncbi:MAG: ribonuclease P protein component [Lentisphaeria bacterium]|nr:ribonuclease P protein component [Lentisphaeria bacterium]
MSALLPIQNGSARLKGERALHNAEFKLMRSIGQKISTRNCIVIWADAPDSENHLGLVVSKRFHRHAVQRNRARRLIRESYRLLKGGFQKPVWIVIIPRYKMQKAKLQDVQKDMIYALSKVGVMDAQKSL